MDARFQIYNSHVSFGVKHFLEHDPQLSFLRTLPLAYDFPLVKQLPHETAGIYTLGGGRQIGKSTLLKQWMAYLMTESEILPKQILFLTGDIIDDHHQLLQIFTQSLQTMPKNTLLFIIIDEITYIEDWDRCIKFLADSGQLNNVILMLSGSDLTMTEEARMRFPGRRGKADIVDFHLYPLSFFEYLQLTQKKLADKINDNLSNDQLNILCQSFESYLEHGGYLSAINDLAQTGKISNATIMTYSDWVRGDMLKRGKQEVYVRELCSGIIKHYTSQISWNNLAKSLSIDHHKTVADYVDLLGHMDALFVQHALLEDKLAAAPKKAKKVFFTDPFVFHSLYAWVNPSNNIYDEQIVPSVNSNEIAAQLVETVVVNHFRRHYETYYIKAEGEIDIAYIDKGKFWPIEIKWRNQLHPKELKQVQKYKNAVIWSKSTSSNTICGIPTIPLPLALARMG